MRLRSGVLFSGLVVLIVSLALGPQTVFAQQDSPTPIPPIVLFRDDFTTHADRWKLISLDKATIRYDEKALALRIEAKPDNYALWSVPDTDLKPDRFDIQVQGTWVTGSSDALFGLVVNYRSDTDMLLATVTRGGQVRVGNYYFGVLTDLASPVQIQLDAAQPVSMRAVMSNTDNAHQLDIYVNAQKVQNVALDNFRAGSFGIFASSGGSGGLNVAFNNFTVSDPG